MEQYAIFVTALCFTFVGITIGVFMAYRFISKDHRRDILAELAAIEVERYKTPKHIDSGPILT